MRRRSIPPATPAYGTRHGDTVRSALDRGSGSVTAVVLFSSVVLLALGGLAGAGVILRVTDALRSSEIAAVTVATRAIAGDPTPCEPAITAQQSCVVSDGVATVRLTVDGVSVTAVAGPER